MKTKRNVQKHVKIIKGAYMMNKIKGMFFNKNTNEIEYDKDEPAKAPYADIKPYSVPLTPREPKKPFLQKAKEAAKTYYGTMLKPLAMMLPTGCGDSGDQYCQLEKLGDNFSLDKPSYVKPDGEGVDLMGAKLRGTTIKGTFGDQAVRGYSSKHKTNPRRDYIYMDKEHAADADGTLSKLVTLHELGHNVFDRPHVGGDIFTDAYYTPENVHNRYDEKGCSLNIMDTLRTDGSVTNQCYEDNKDMYKEQFRSWVKEFLEKDENRYKCAGVKKGF